MPRRLRNPNVDFLRGIDSEPRRTGRTTRLVDAYIQQLFRKGEITFTDHHPSQRGRRMAFDTLVERLYAEHGGRENFEVITGEFKVRIRR
jgi:hypothetical protein